MSVCPPETPLFHEAHHRRYIKSGPCPGGYGFLMKRVAALGGDSVTIGANGVLINGVLSPHSVPFMHDGAGRPLPQAYRTHYVLEDSEVLLLSDTADRSFDSRYFGPLSRRQIESVIVPVLTWSAETKQNVGEATLPPTPPRFSASFRRVDHEGRVETAVEHSACSKNPPLAHRTQRDGTEIKVDLIAEFLPQIVGQATAFIVVAAGGGSWCTSCGLDRLIDGKDDV